MARFADSTGREWDLRLTLGILPDLKKIDCDLGAAVKSGDWLGELIFGEPVRLANILWEFLREQATKAGIDREGFDDLLDADFIDAAAAALQSEIIDFFHRGQRKHLKEQFPKILAKLETSMGKVTEQAAGRAMEEMETKMTSILSGSAGNSVGSSE